MTEQRGLRSSITTQGRRMVGARALQAYAALTTSAARGAVRDLKQLER